MPTWCFISVLTSLLGILSFLGPLIGCSWITPPTPVVITMRGLTCHPTLRSVWMSGLYFAVFSLCALFGNLSWQSNMWLQWIVWHLVQLALGSGLAHEVGVVRSWNNNSFSLWMQMQDCAARVVQGKRRSRTPCTPNPHHDLLLCKSRKTKAWRATRPPPPPPPPTLTGAHRKQKWKGTRFSGTCQASIIRKTSRLVPPTQSWVFPNHSPRSLPFRHTIYATEIWRGSPSRHLPLFRHLMMPVGLPRPSLQWLNEEGGALKGRGRGGGYGTPKCPWVLKSILLFRRGETL